MEKEIFKYVIGVDGGATKTRAVLADLNGKILKFFDGDSASLRNNGIDESVKNIARAIKGVLPGNKKEIFSICIGLPDVAEEFGRKIKDIEKSISRKINFKNVKVISDQIVAFKSGTNERNGVVLIAGTGSIARGWNKGKEEKASGWGWLAEEGCSFWAGREALQAVFRNLDDGNENILTKKILEKFGVKSANNLAAKIYSENVLEKVSSLAQVLDEAANEGDLDAKSILSLAGRRASLAAGIVVRKLDFYNSFTLVLAGSMFISKDFKNSAEECIKEFAPNAKVVFSENPALGAVKIAIENYEQRQ